jgi:hypothetical protein
MMYLDFSAGERTYKLRLNTRAIVALEKQLGCNPVSIFGDGDTIPTITTMVQILHASLQAYEHGIGLNDAFDIFDKWIADGNAMTDFVSIILDIYKVSGILKNGNATEDTEKN